MMPGPRDRRDSRFPPAQRRRDDEDRERDYGGDRDYPRYSKDREEGDRERDNRRRTVKEESDEDDERDRRRGQGRERDDRNGERRRDRDDDRQDRGSYDRRDGRDDKPRSGADCQDDPVSRPRSARRSPPSRRRSRSPPPAFPTFGPPQSPAEGSRDPSQPPEDKSRPNFLPSGALAAATNTVNGVVLKYNEPPEARKPKDGWRVYVFKGEENIEILRMEGKSCWLVGRDKVVCDILVEHPSCSKQHAVIQYRQVTIKSVYGDTSTLIKPFIIDLDSTNGTFVNDEEIPKSRYYELREKDVIRFGQSTREYVLLHEDTA